MNDKLLTIKEHVLSGMCVAALLGILGFALCQLYVGGF